MSSIGKAGKKSLSIKFKLLFQLVMAVMVILALSTLSFFQMTKLGKLQDEGYSRDQQATLAVQASYVDDALYRIIADSIINHDMSTSETLWNKEKTQAQDLLSKVVKAADTQDEKKWANDAKTALDNFMAVYEKEMLPILKGADYSVDKIQAIDAKLDGFSEIISNSLQKYSASLGQESVEGNDVFDSQRAGSIRLNMIISITASILLVIFCLFIMYSVLKPIEYAVKVLDTVANGDLTKSVEDKYLRNDEVGKLLVSTNKMMGSLREIIHGVVRESNIVSHSINDAQKSINILMHQIDEVSVTTEELAAGMEETAASTQEMNATSAEIGGAVEAMASKAQKGTERAGEISDRADSLKNNAVESQKQAYEVYKQSQEKLINAIEKSKAVDSINELSNAILGITSQTNLLALNAAIEAARAGEAGKGFTVVAEEIRKLANESRDTAMQIQDITKSVITAVENLSISSGRLLNFIDEQVIKDYDTLVNTGELYSKDANYVDALVSDFSATSEELTASIENMLSAINQVTDSANEGAEGTSGIAQKITIVGQKADEVVKLSQAANASADKLNQMVSVFKI